jgi:phosphoenolpyruvate-protein phosphotransferase (PTS system enzyme I)
LSTQEPHLELTGISVSPGVAIGRAFLHSKEIPPIRRRLIRPDQVEDEAERFLSALHQAGEGIRRTRRLVSGEHSEDLAQIFDAQLAMVDDVEMKTQTLSCIRAQHWSAERAFKLTLEHMMRSFESIEDEYLRQRISDLIDIEQQVLLRLVGGDIQALDSLKANAVVLAHDLLPSESVRLGGGMVKGIALDVGGPASHSAIIARSLGLPTVLGVEGCSHSAASGDRVIIDGNEGLVHLRPTPDVLRDYRTQLRRQQRRERSLTARRKLPAVTRDGHEIALLANIDMPAEVQLAAETGAHGVGMYRTEFLYLGYQLPTEEEQLAAYSKIVQAMAPWPVTIRTIDLGGDKLAHALDSPVEANPYLGWRGIRISLDTPELFRTQLRAILRAGVHGEVRILLPMVASLEELLTAREILTETKEELRRSGTAFGDNCPLGVMVEVPSVALMADHFAAEADFLSLGTNDLIQYTLAVDRGNARVAPLYDPFHPAVLRLIAMVADSGHRHRIPVSICGEIGGDPLATVLLIGMGIERLSMSPGLIPEVKEVIRSTGLARAREIADSCRTLRTGADIKSYLEAEIGPQLPYPRSRRATPPHTSAG